MNHVFDIYVSEMLAENWYNTGNNYDIKSYLYTLFIPNI